MANGSGNVSNVDNLGGAANSAFPSVVLPHDVPVVQLVGSGGASNAIYIFQQCAGTVQGAYQVPTGQTFKAIGYWTTSTSAATSKFVFAQSTAAPSQASSVGTPPAGSVYYNSSGSIASAGDAALGSGFALGTTAAPAGIYWVPTPGLEFTADYYPYYVSDGGTAFSVILIGYLV